MGKLIVIEGTDGSGKSTQFRLLTQRLENENIAFQKIVFPQYSEPSSALIRMYLGGEFGTNPSDVNAYAASTFFAVDRYASYLGTVVRAGRSCGLRPLHHLQCRPSGVQGAGGNPTGVSQVAVRL